MNSFNRLTTDRVRRIASPITISILMLCVSSVLAVPPPQAGAQGPPPNVHLWHDARTPVGVIGQTRLAHPDGRNIVGYPQPIELRGPQGVEISFVAGNAFMAATPLPAKAGMLVGPAYRVRLSNIPHNAGRAVYPTIEVIDRLQPPAGQEARFPIVIELTLDDLLLALEGKHVTRVVYVEPPREAAPVRDEAGQQRWFEVTPERDPIAVADSLGRPVAIVRIGGRMPLAQGGLLDADFTYGCPPVRFYSESAVETPLTPTEAVQRNPNIAPVQTSGVMQQPTRTPQMYQPPPVVPMAYPATARPY